MTTTTDNMAFNLPTITEEINTLIAAGAALASAIIGFKVGQKNLKRADTDNESGLIDNAKKVADLWEDYGEKMTGKLADLDQKYGTVLLELTEIRKQHIECENAKDVLARKVECLEGDVCALKEKLA
jgi:hypothetical protein